MRVVAALVSCLFVCLISPPAQARHHVRHCHHYRHHQAADDKEKKPHKEASPATARPADGVYHRRPFRLTGLLKIGAEAFEFVSGGAGWSIPWGDHKISSDPNDLGPWGKRHGAIAFTDDISDPQLGRKREGIEIHPLQSSEKTEGCVGIRENFASLKKAVLALINKDGSAFLHIGPTGAEITATKDSPLPSFTYVPERIEESHERTARHHHHSRLAHHGKRHHLAMDNKKEKRT